MCFLRETKLDPLRTFGPFGMNARMWRINFIEGPQQYMPMQIWKFKRCASAVELCVCVAPTLSE
jgi:hypothetical protein